MFGLVYLLTRFAVIVAPIGSGPSPANTTNGATIACPPDENGCGGSTGLPQVNFDSTAVHTIFQLVFGIIGAIAVIFIIIAGLRLITSSGDPDAVNTARQTIIYAAIGLIVAVSAEIIVTFVLGRL